MNTRLFLVYLLISLLASIGLGQNVNWNLTGAGARAEGFGGAFIGVADDATAIVWNPAGLTQLERTEVSAVGQYISETSEFKSELPNNKYTVSTTQSHFNFNFASLAVPFTMAGTNVVVAVAYQSQLDFFSKERDQQSETESDGAANAVTPGIAIRLSPVFSIGATTNVWFGSFESTTKYTSGPYQGDVDVMKPSFSGLNFGAGVLIDFGGLSNPIPVKLGASFKTPFTLKADVDYSSTSPSSSSSAKINWETEMPLMVGIGASVLIGENLTLAADYEMRMFKDKKTTYSYGGFTFTQPLSASNEDLNQFQVGAEYLIVTRAGVIPLRGGFRTVPTVRANYSWNRDSLQYYPTDQVGGKGYSAGTGFISSSFALDFAYSHEQYDEQKWTDAGGTDFTNNYAFDRFSLSLIVYF
ncbi:MAG TPA: hypothetical protein DGH68_05420 [Bacteroidetes bacterium]|nr:hypothetical protein [Bacteroidota bacterium]